MCDYAGIECDERNEKGVPVCAYCGVGLGEVHATRCDAPSRNFVVCRGDLIRWQGELW